MFARHHYLNGSLAPTARCFTALWNEEPVAFCATLPLIGRHKHWRITRLVVLPDFQGVGIGMRVAEAVAELHRTQGHRINITASHPAVLAHCRRSPRWRLVQLRRTGSRPSPRYNNYRGAPARPVASFEFMAASGGRRLPDVTAQTSEPRAAPAGRDSRAPISRDSRVRPDRRTEM
jgi:GNAT superfamily N-acetyltransferase